MNRHGAVLRAPISRLCERGTGNLDGEIDGALRWLPQSQSGGRLTVRFIKTWRVMERGGKCSTTPLSRQGFCRRKYLCAAAAELVTFQVPFTYTGATPALVKVAPAITEAVCRS